MTQPTLDSPEGLFPATVRPRFLIWCWIALAILAGAAVLVLSLLGGRLS